VNSTSAIVLEGFGRDFCGIPAVSDLSFEVRAGEIVGLLGPNGAGKTTTLRVLAGVLAPSRGRVRIGEGDALEPSSDRRARVGYLAEGNPLYESLDVWQHFSFLAELRGLSDAQTRDRFRLLSAECGLSPVVDRPVHELSKGFRQRLGLALALADDPPVLLLDEPGTALDPHQRKEIWELIGRIRRDKAVLFSTHILREAESLCDRLVVLDRGRLVTQGTPADVVAAFSAPPAVLTIRLRGPREAAATLAALEGVTGVETLPDAGDGEWRLRIHFNEDPREAVARTAVARGWVLRDVQLERPALDDVFRRLAPPHAP
jgi:ABC-2 type transport system ATP-binding protein